MTEPPVWVLLHGWGGNSALWEALRAHLPGESVRIDLPGHGAEGLLSEELFDTEETWQRYIERVALQLPARAILVGWSLGGMLATQLAAHIPERVEALITIACNPCFVAREGWSKAMAANVFLQFCEDFNTHPEKTWQRFCALQAQGDNARRSVLQILKQPGPPPPDVAARWAQLLRWLSQMDNRHALADLKCPHLHFYGEGDALVPSSVIDDVALLGNAATQLIPGAGHAPHVSAPRAVSVQIKVWLQSQKGISKPKIARSFAAAAATYDAAAHLQRRVAQQLADEIPEFDGHEHVLDLGCGTGFVTQALLQRGCAPRVTLVDLAEPMVAFAKKKLPEVTGLVADAEALPFTAASLDGVYSSLALQWCPDLTRVGKEVERCLRPGGSFMFTTLGPATLHELKQAWAAVDDYVHVNTFKTAAQVRAELGETELSVECIRQVPVILHYQQLMHLLKELKAIGAHNMNVGQKLGLGGRGQFRQLERAYFALANEQGLLPVTYDVLLVVVKKHE